MNNFDADKRALGIAHRLTDMGATVARLDKERIAYIEAQNFNTHHLQANADAWMDRASYGDIQAVLNIATPDKGRVTLEDVVEALNREASEADDLRDFFFGEDNEVMPGDMQIIVDRIVANWRLLQPHLSTSTVRAA